jgi:hypothetical protein
VGFLSMLSFALTLIRVVVRLGCGQEFPHSSAAMPDQFLLSF